MATDNGNGNNKRNGPGQGLMRPPWIIALLAYLLIVLGFVIYTMISVWPPLRPKETKDSLVAEAKKATDKKEAAEKAEAEKAAAAVKAAEEKAAAEKAAAETRANANQSPAQAGANQARSQSPATSPAATGQAAAQQTATAPSSSGTAATTQPVAAQAAAGAEQNCETKLGFKEGFCLNEKASRELVSAPLESSAHATAFTTKTDC